MESPVIKIMLIAAGIAAAAAVVAVMWTQLAQNTEAIDNTATNAYTLATSETLCEALPEGHWYRQLESDGTSADNVKQHTDNDAWEDGGKCGKGDGKSDTDKRPEGVPSVAANVISQETSYNIRVSGGSGNPVGGKWVIFDRP